MKRFLVSLGLIVILMASQTVCAASETPPPSSSPSEVNLLVLGDWGSDKRDQATVAQAMVNYVRSTGATVYDASLLVGDNFYVKLASAEDPVWTRLFETMYDPKVLAMPFYALLGNHDYEEQGQKARIELAYAGDHPASRWKMPAKWYRLDFPPDHPLVTVLMLDTMVEHDESDQQIRWLQQELAKPGRGEWTIACGHFPLYDNGKHGDNARLIKDWEPLFERHNVDFYLAGHDHNLQHLQLPGHTTSYIISGGGGAATYAMKRADRGPFGRQLHGFVHLQLTPPRALVRFLSADGKSVHVFERTPAGQIHVSHTTGLDHPGPATAPPGE